MDAERLIDIFYEIIDSNQAREYFEDTTLTNTENNLEDFFGNAPTDAIRNILEDFVSILFKYDTGKRNDDLYKFIRKEPEKKPITQINQDIATIKKYQEMIQRLYGGKSKKDGNYSLFNPPKEIKENYFNNIKILDDLQSQKFKTISKIRYYEFEKTTKQPIKDFLVSINERYNLQIKSTELKTYIDSL